MPRKKTTPKKKDTRLFKAKRVLTDEQKKEIASRGKHFSSEYQPSPEAKKAGMLKAKAKNIVLQTIIKEVAESMTEIKVKGELQTVSMLEALVKKMIALASKDDKALLRVINMVLEYESRNAVLTQRQEIIDRRNGDNDDETFNDSFIQALNAQAGEVWTNNE